MGNIYICGDLHGSAANIQSVINQIDNPTIEDVIIVAGDAGFEYENNIAGSAKKATRKFPGSWIVVRGNHDSRYWKKHSDITYSADGTPSSFSPHQGWLFTEDGQYIYQKKYPNIKYIYDAGGLYWINGYSFLFVPGAYSVDKQYRLERNYPWNPEEQLSKIEQKHLLDLVRECNWDGTPIDFVVGHTFPYHIEPYYKHLFLDFIDQSSVDKSMEKFLQVLSYNFEQNPHFKHYFGGHFHSDIDDMRGKYTMLYYFVADIKDYV